MTPEPQNPPKTRIRAAATIDLLLELALAALLVLLATAVNPNAPADLPNRLLEAVALTSFVHRVLLQRLLGVTTGKALLRLPTDRPNPYDLTAAWFFHVVLPAMLIGFLIVVIEAFIDF